MKWVGSKKAIRELPIGRLATTQFELLAMTLTLVLTSLPVLMPRATVRPVCGVPRAASTCSSAGVAAFELPAQPAPNERSATGWLQGRAAPVWAALHGRKRAPDPVATAEFLAEEEEEDWIRERREEEDRSFQAWRDTQRQGKAAAWEEETTALRAAEAEQLRAQQQAERLQAQQQQARQQAQQQLDEESEAAMRAYKPSELLRATAAEQQAHDQAEQQQAQQQTQQQTQEQEQAHVQDEEQQQAPAPPAPPPAVLPPPHQAQAQVQLQLQLQSQAPEEVQAQSQAQRAHRAHQVHQARQARQQAVQPPPQQQQPQGEAAAAAGAEAGAGGSFLAQAEQAVADYEVHFSYYYSVVGSGWRVASR